MLRELKSRAEDMAVFRVSHVSKKLSSPTSPTCRRKSAILFKWSQLVIRLKFGGSDGLHDGLRTCRIILSTSFAPPNEEAGSIHEMGLRHMDKNSPTDVLERPQGDILEWSRPWSRKWDSRQTLSKRRKSNSKTLSV